MRGHVAQLTPAGLHRFLPEHTVSTGLLQELVWEWSARSAVVVWGVLGDSDAEAIWEMLAAGQAYGAGVLLRDRAVELLPVRSGARELWPFTPAAGCSTAGLLGGDYLA
jgi:hypothetical protein